MDIYLGCFLCNHADKPSNKWIRVKKISPWLAMMSFETISDIHVGYVSIIMINGKMGGCQFPLHQVQYHLPKT